MNHFAHIELVEDARAVALASDAARRSGATFVLVGMVGRDTIESLRAKVPKWCRDVRVAGKPVAVNATATAQSIAVIVTCHAAYLSFLPATLASIDAQQPPAAERILCLDGCQFTPPEGWRVISGEWRNPNPARNAGFRASVAPWCVFWDGDDRMPQGYLSALQNEFGDKKTAIVYPALTRGDANAQPNEPEWSYWRQRQFLSIQSGAAWSRTALDQVEGWDELATVYDDGNLAARVTALGWLAKRLPSPVVNLTQHNLGHRWKASDEERSAQLWRFRTLTVIIPAWRDARIPTLAKQLEDMELPSRTSLLLGDSTYCGVEPLLEAAWKRELQGVAVRRVWRVPHDDCRTGMDRHQHVAALYNELFRAQSSDMVLTWEDDVDVSPDALRTLWNHFVSGSSVGAAAAVYESASQPGFVCGSRATDSWRAEVPMSEAPTQPESWGFVPGGFTLWAGHAIRHAMPFRASFLPSGAVAGWDYNASAAIRRNGLRLVIDGRVKVKHCFTAA